MQLIEFFLAVVFGLLFFPLAWITTTPFIIILSFWDKEKYFIALRKRCAKVSHWVKKYTIGII